MMPARSLRQSTAPVIMSAALERQAASPISRQILPVDWPGLSVSLSADWVLQYCGLAVIETKNRAMAMVEKLEQQLDMPKKVRIHWTGCPNSCGQVSPCPVSCKHLTTDEQTDQRVCLELKMYALQAAPSPQRGFKHLSGWSS